MTQIRKSMALSLFVVPTGHHEASWRLPGSPAEHLYDVHYYGHVVRRAEAAGLDAVFFADAPALRTEVRHNTGGSVLEPLTLLGALAMMSETIGLIATASTTYSEPYNLARAFSSLDHISGGRVGWNMVTTAFSGAASNFGKAAHPDRNERYSRAEEFVTVTKALWDSWQPEAIVCDRQNGIYVDRSQVIAPNHSGHHFDVAGPFQSARSPQRYPLLVQAGASPAGRSFAARHAEVLFSVQRDINAARAYREDVRARALRHGRDPEGIISLPGLSIHVAHTRAEVREKEEYLNSFIIPAYGIKQIQTVTGVDLSAFGLDDMILPEVLKTQAPPHENTTRRDEIIALASEKRLTLRSLLSRIAGARTHRVLVGTPSDIADSMQRWFESGACDGFNLMPPALPDGLNDFVDLVLPELERRGCRAKPETGLLRARFGLPPLPNHPAEWL